MDAERKLGGGDQPAPFLRAPLDDVARAIGVPDIRMRRGGITWPTYSIVSGPVWTLEASLFGWRRALTRTAVVRTGAANGRPAHDKTDSVVVARFWRAAKGMQALADMRRLDYHGTLPEVES